MDARIELKNNDRLSFPGMECIVERSLGRGSNVIAYVGRYRDHQNPELFHRVLIRELFPYDPKGGIFRDSDGSIHIDSESQPLYDLNRRTFLRGNEVHVHLLEENPSDIDLNINTFEYNNTLYSLVGYSGGRNLYEELERNYWKNKKVPVAEKLMHIVRIVKGALGVLQSFHRSGYLHLDISPDNILLIGEGGKERVTLIDYNSVHTIDELQGGFSVYYSTKEGFTAPEVRGGRNGQIREWTDLYSMTAVLHHCLTGRNLTLMQMVGIQPISSGPEDSPFLKDSPETVIAMVRQILRRGLSVTTGRRYQKADQMLVDLEELEDRIEGRGITHWALWENSRERIRRSLKENPAMDYLLDERKIYPLYAETEDGEKIPLLQNLQELPFHRDQESLAEERDRHSDKTAGTVSSIPSKRNAPLLLLGGGGTGKTTALLRIACRQDSRYHASSAFIYYISLYGYRSGEQDYICDTILKSMRFKQNAGSWESSRQELIRLLDKPSGGENLILLDGLNEASGDTGPLLEEINRFSELAGVRIILTSRSDPGNPLFQKLTLCPLDPGQIRRALAEEGIIPPENMEIFTLLGFPLLLSIYIRTVKDGEEQISPQSREQLMERYFAAILDKEKKRLPEWDATAAGIEAGVLYLLPEIAALSEKKQSSLSSEELLELTEKCYRELSRRALTAVYPEWIGRTRQLRMGAATADEWYGKTILELLWKRLGLLVRDEQGRFRIVHQLLEEYLARQSEVFHRRFDLEKKRLRTWTWIIALAGALAIAAVFLMYAVYKNGQLARREREAQRNESVALAYASRAKLERGDRQGALTDARAALPLEGADRPYVAAAERALTDALYVYRKDRYHPSGTFTWENEIVRYALSEDGSRFVTVDEHKNVVCLDTFTNSPIWTSVIQDAEDSHFSTKRKWNWDYFGYRSSWESHFPDSVFPFVRILQSRQAVLCAGERGDAVLFSLEDGKELLNISYKDFPLENPGAVIGLADLSPDEKTLVLGMIAARQGEDMENLSFMEKPWDGFLLFFDMNSGKCLACTESFPNPDGDHFLFTGKGSFCSDSTIYTAEISDVRTKEKILFSVDTATAKLVRMLKVGDAPAEEDGATDSYSEILNVRFEDNSEPDDLLYFRCVYDYNVNIGYYGTVMLGYLPCGAQEWAFYRQYDLIGNPANMPSLLLYDNMFYLLSGKEVVCINRAGEEKRDSLGKEILYVLHEAGSSTASLVFTDGTVGMYSLRSMEPINFDEFGKESTSYSYASYALLSGATLQGAFGPGGAAVRETDATTGSGRKEPPFCLVLSDDPKKAVLCRYFPDTDSTILPEPDPDDFPSLKADSESGKDFNKGEGPVPSWTRDIFPLPDQTGFLVIDDTDLGEDEQDQYVYKNRCILYDSKGVIQDRFSFLSDVSFETDKLTFSGDGKAFYRGGYRFDFTTRTLTCLEDLPEALKPGEGVGASLSMCSAMTDRGILTAWWDKKAGEMILWMDGNLEKQTVPPTEQSDDAKKGTGTGPGFFSLHTESHKENGAASAAEIILPDRSFDSNYTPKSDFRFLETGANGLVLMACSYGEETDSIIFANKPVGYYLVYSLREDRWQRIELAETERGFPHLACADRKKWFASFEEDNTMSVYDFDSGEKILHRKLGIDYMDVVDMSFILDDQYLVIKSFSGEVMYHVLRLSDGETVFSWNPANGSRYEGFLIQEDPDMQRLYILNGFSGNGGICIDTLSWESLFEIESLCCVLKNGTMITLEDGENHIVQRPCYSLKELLKMSAREK